MENEVITLSLLSERKAIEKTYTDICTVYAFVKNKDKSITKTGKALLFENMQCALSQKNMKPTNQGSMTNTISYDAKLFLAPEVNIKPGSHIEIKRLSRLYNFISTGEAFVYETHQEIMLQRSDKA